MNNSNNTSNVNYSNSLKPFDTTGLNVFFKREIKEIKTGIDDIDSYLVDHFKIQKQKQLQIQQQIQQQQTQQLNPQQVQQAHQIQVQQAYQAQQQYMLQIQQQQKQLNSNNSIPQPSLPILPQNTRILNSASNINSNNINNSNNSIVNIQPYKPVNPGIIEIYGPSGSGKTEIALNILVESILPSNKPFNGNEIGVIYFDNDYKFDILKLENLLEKRYNQSINGNNATTTNNRNTVEFQQFLKSCLSRFYLIRCKDSFQFLVTLNGINQFIRNINNNLKEKDKNSNNTNNSNNNNNNNEKKINSDYPNDISLIIIDSISAFFWIDQNGEPLNVKPNLMWIEAIKRLLNENIIVVATKQTIFSVSTNNNTNNNNNQNSVPINKYLHSDQHREFLGVEWSRLVKFRKLVKLK